MTFTCVSDDQLSAAVWVKQSPDLTRLKFLSHNGNPIDQTVDLDKYSFARSTERLQSRSKEGEHG